MVTAHLFHICINQLPFKFCLQIWTDLQIYIDLNACTSQNSAHPPTPVYISIIQFDLQYFKHLLPYTIPQHFAYIFQMSNKEYLHHCKKDHNFLVCQMKSVVTSVIQYHQYSIAVLVTLQCKEHIFTIFPKKTNKQKTS